MTLLSAVVAIFLGVAIATAAEVGAPIQARQGSSITLFTGRGFTGTSTTIGGDLCVSIYHLSTTSRTDFNGLAPL